MLDGDSGAVGGCEAHLMGRFRLDIGDARMQCQTAEAGDGGRGCVVPHEALSGAILGGLEIVAPQRH